MELHFRKTGSGRPLVLLHGLFGSGDNWLTLASKMKGFEVWLPDFRNHGASPWTEDFSIPLLAGDIAGFLDHQGIKEPLLAGHSLGGKAAMELALTYPRPLKGLVVLDMAPRAYEPKYEPFVPLMRSMDLRSLANRREAQALLEKTIDTPTVQFLLKNLVTGDDGALRWRLNLQTLGNHYDEIWKPLEGNRQSPLPALFLRGENSDYIRDQDAPLVRQFFPRAEISTVARAGHWLHAENPGEVLGKMKAWLVKEGLDSGEPWV